MTAPFPKTVAVEWVGRELRPIAALDVKRRYLKLTAKVALAVALLIFRPRVACGGLGLVILGKCAFRFRNALVHRSALFDSPPYRALQKAYSKYLFEMASMGLDSSESAKEEMVVVKMGGRRPHLTVAFSCQFPISMR